MNQPTTSNRAREAAGMARQESPGTEISVVEQRVQKRVAVVQSMLPALTAAMANETSAKQMIRDAITAIRTMPKLAECTQESFLGALMTAAQTDMRPNVPALGHAWILPYKNGKTGQQEAQFQLGYPGVVELGFRSGVQIMARTIFAHENHRIEYGLNEILEHTPILEPEKRGDPILHYAIARVQGGGAAWVVISHQEALQSRDNSPGYKFGGPDNPWRKHLLPMCRKSAVLKLKNFIPKASPQLALGLYADSTVRTSTESDAVMTPAVEAMTEPTTYAATDNSDPATGHQVVDAEPTTVTRADPPAPDPAPTPADPPARSRRRPKASTKATKPEAPEPDPAPAPEPEAKPTKERVQVLQEAHPHTWQTALSLLAGKPFVASEVTARMVEKAIKLTEEQIEDAQLDAAASEDGL